MNIVFPILIGALTLSQEIDELIQSSLQGDNEEIMAFLEQLPTEKMAIPSQQGKSKSKCPTTSFLTDGLSIENDNESNKEKPHSITVRATNLQICMSFSVPFETWKEYSYLLEKTNGEFILKGLPNNSFGDFARALKDLRQAGVNAPIQIDPETFELHQVKAVPTIIFSEGTKIDKIIGNIKLDEAIRFFAESGENKEQAQQILQQFKKAGEG